MNSTNWAKASGLALFVAIPILGTGIGIVFLTFASFGSLGGLARYGDRLSLVKFLAFAPALPIAWFGWAYGAGLHSDWGGAFTGITVVLWVYVFLYVWFDDRRNRLVAELNERSAPESEHE